MKVLILHMKHEEVVIDASHEKAAFLCAFNLLDEFSIYDGFLLDKDHKAFYKAAKKGDANAATNLLHSRQSYEYEGWYMATVIEP